MNRTAYLITVLLGLHHSLSHLCSSNCSSSLFSWSYAFPRSTKPQSSYYCLPPHPVLCQHAGSTCLCLMYLHSNVFFFFVTNTETQPRGCSVCLTSDCTTTLNHSQCDGVTQGSLFPPLLYHQGTLHTCLLTDKVSIAMSLRLTLM